MCSLFLLPLVRHSLLVNKLLLIAEQTSVYMHRSSAKIMDYLYDCTQVWDLRKNAVVYKMRGHTDTITGMELSPDGSYLLSNGMDNSGQSIHIYIISVVTANAAIAVAVRNH